jgi:hypothetical protein
MRNKEIINKLEKFAINYNLSKTEEQRQKSKDSAYEFIYAEVSPSMVEHYIKYFSYHTKTKGEIND